MKQLMAINTPFTDVAATANLPGEAAWLSNLRTQAKGVFERHGLPASKVEDWKYTSLWALSQANLNHDVIDVSLKQDTADELALLADGYRVVIVNGQFDAAVSVLPTAIEGVSVELLSQSIDHLEACLNTTIDIDKPGFNALNTMLMQEGVVIKVAANTVVDKAIEIMVVQTATEQAVHLRHVIELGENAQANVIEHYVSQGDTDGLTNVISEVILGESAVLNHYKLQHEAMAQTHIATLAAKQATSSTWNNSNITLGAKLTRNDIHTQLLGEQSHATLDGMYLTKDEQHVDNHTRIDHAVPNTTSEELYKGVLDDSSHAVFNGKVVVHKDAQKTDANQSNKNLLLSRQCEIDSKPEMEIYADDVKCGHGSAIGQLDEQQIFFLRARGLDEVSARSLLTYAFAIEVLQRISDESIRDALSAVVEDRLPKGVSA
jgi:Fe-S cluster assembly protein SufD